jgi:Uma2 family endonuclease
VTDPDGFVSPSQTTTQLALKVQFYRTNGVDKVWLLDHCTRTVEVWTAEGRATLDDAATLTSPLLPRFAVAVSYVLDG